MYPRIRACLAAASIALLGSSIDARSAEAIAVTVDAATLVKLPEKVGTIIVGNPLIADVTIQAGNLLVVTGKGFGATNLLALDRQGNVLLDKNVLVSGPKDHVLVVYSGSERRTYSCEPRCERRITLGDSTDYFTATLGQSGARNTQATASSSRAGPQ